MRVGCALRAAQLVLLLLDEPEARPAKFLGAKLFNQADSPYAGDPPIPLFGDKCGEVTVIKDARLTSYGSIITQPYFPPSCSDWSQVILRLDGAVRGLQFDRFGAVWLSGVELLRTTTPEPTEDGIRWQALRDVSHVASLLQKPGNMTVHIPNVVNNQYTGVLQVSISLEFYSPEHKLFGPILPKIVRPLQYQEKPSIIALGLSGGQTQTNLISDLPRNMVNARLELFASGHNCEEFWYANAPEEDSYTLSEDMKCGGGAYREIEVYVDGKIAGAAYPFPVIYTGGLNPLLWRPQTGIASFNVPPYNFDLSPFVGLLNDGKTHNISLTVRNNDNHGVWYLDGVLHADLDKSGTEYTGKLYHHSHISPEPVVDKRHDDNVPTYTTRGARKIKILGSLENTRTGSRKMFSVMYNLEAENVNTVMGKSMQATHGWLHSTTTHHKVIPGMKMPLLKVVRQSTFPFIFFDHTAKNLTTIENGPSKVNYSRILRIRVERPYQPMYHLELASNIYAHAIYNQSLGSDYMSSKENGFSEEKSSLFAGTHESSCFHSHLKSAVNGKLAKAKHNTQETCHWHKAPGGLYNCGLSFCNQIDGMGRSPRGFRESVHTSQYADPEIDSDIM